MLKVSTMDSRKIIKKITKREFSTIYDDIQMLISGGEKPDCSDICSVLQSLYQAVVPTSIELESEDAQRRVIDLVPSINFCIDHASNFACSDLIKHQFFPVIYHVIRTFIKVELFQPAILSGNILKNLLTHPENDFCDRLTYIRNMSVIFWNEAHQIEKNPKSNDPDTSFALRTASIDFLLLEKTGIDAVGEKISINLLRYSQNSSNIDTEKIGNFLQDMWSHLESFDSSYEHKAYLCKILNTWFDILLKYVKDLSFTHRFISWFQDLSDSSNKKKGQKVLNICAGLSKLCIKCFLLQENDLKVKKMCLQYVEFCRIYKQWNDTEAKILAHTCEVIYSCFAKCFRHPKALEDKKFLTFMKSSLNMCVVLVQCYIEMSVKVEVQKHLPFSASVKFFVCHTLMNLFMTLIKKEENENQKKQLIRESEDFVKFTLTHLSSRSLTTETTGLSKSIIGYGTCISRFGMSLYNSRHYSECTYFLEAADSFLSLSLSMDNSNEETSHSLWKIHEILAYAYFLSGNHEKALFVTAKSMTIHEKKTKECFELWRKVKREAVRNGKESLVPNTVSDAWLNFNITIDMEKQIALLVEEFKACKAERYQFENEIISVVQKLLNLPCPKSVRAYILLQIITMPSNVSENISFCLKKSLAEMSLEAINLYRDHLFENCDDHSAKLHLSLVYFWVYHENLKKIHDIAQKEAENLSKPLLPEPKAAVRTDFGDHEENDTCDIQPTHSLVCLSVENETFKNLESAVQLWEEISGHWQDLGGIVKDESVLDIIQATANIYAAAVHDAKELTVWLLLQKASTATGDKLHELTACISLINFLLRLGYLNMASYFLNVVESCSEYFKSSEFKITKMKFLLAKSNYFLHTGKFDEGLKIVEDILKNPILEKRYKSIKMLTIQALLLQSEYLSLPRKAFSQSENLDSLKTNFQLASLMESASLCKSVLKNLTEKQAAGNSFDWLCFKPLLIRNLLKSYLLLGEVYLKAGEPRFARCYLQDALKIAESHIFTYWSSKILIVLGHIDLLCDNFKDCQVKTSGLKYILSKEERNSLEILAQLQAKYASPELDDPSSPDSTSDLILYSVPDLALSRQIKQTYIDKMEVMSSPVSKRLAKNKSDRVIQCSYADDAFSIHLLQLESSFLSLLLAQTETTVTEPETVLQELLDQYNQMKNPNNLRSILASIRLVERVKEPLFRVQSRPETLLCISVMMQKVQLYSMRNDMVQAKKTIDLAYSFLKKSSHNPNYLYPDAYALLRYHEIRISLCGFLKIDSSFSLTYHLCPSIKSNVSFKKMLLEKTQFENTPNTPMSKKIPKVVVSHLSSKANRCQAPLKKNLLNTNLKKDIELLNAVSVDACSPFRIFLTSSSSEEEQFESPYDSFSRASKTRSGPKKDTKKSDKNDVSYRFFKSKNDTFGVKSASDVWNLPLADTPKLGKENRKLRSKNLLKPSLDVKKKTKSANSGSSRSLKSSKLKKSKSKDPVRAEDAQECDETLKQNSTSFALSQLSERKLSIEHARSSPFYEIHRKSQETKRSNKDGYSLCIGDDFISDSVFSSPSKSAKMKVPNLIDDLCKDLGAMVLSKTKVPPLIMPEKLKDVIDELDDLRLLIQHIMPYPLYADICRLLAVLTLVKCADLQNEQMLHCSYLLSETFSVSLRNVHIANMIYFREPEFVKERGIMLETLKSPVCNMGLQIESFLQLLPENWTVVQVSSFHSEEYLVKSNKVPCPTKLIVCQYRKNCTPLVISTDCSSDERFSSSFLTEFDAILQESNLTMLNKDSKLWWNTRSSLDKRMKELTKCMENIWLGCWKGLFLGMPKDEARVKQIQSTVNAICDSTPCTNRKLLQILIDSAEHLSKEQVSAAVCYLWRCSPEEEIHRKICLSIRNLSIDLPKTDRNHVILILDQSIQSLPWECMPVLKDVPVSRMPSLSLLHTKLAMVSSEPVLTVGIDTSNTYYVLNPGGDLKQSQEHFQKQFERQMKWNGVSGIAPSAKQYVSGFKDHELFIYCGHGSGRQYFEGTSVDKLRLQSTSIIMGCSSGRLRRLGRVLESYGIVLKLLLSGCPSITANLWDVTDKDIDRFTDRLLESLIPNYDEVQSSQDNVAKAVAGARSACKMSHLVGAAPVVYGLPIFAKNH